jgi:hypothetical protein
VAALWSRGAGIAANALRLGVCYFALQILQALDKFNRQNNSTKPLLVAGAVKETKMTFAQFYQTVTKQASVNATKEYVRILWSNAYTIEQAVHNLQTMDES